MTLSQQEIIDYASRYVNSNEVIDFPCNGDLFCLIGRDLPMNRVLTEEEGWNFQGYGICLGYTLDEEAKPPGKWLWMHFASLATFPPAEQVFKLQPPHVVRGRFQNPGRTGEYRIIKVNLNQPSRSDAASAASGKDPVVDAKRQPEPSVIPRPSGKIVKFRRKKESGDDGGSSPMAG
ncbi:MAG: hypothetical protein JXA71_18380 [Chitinispirillaceae bacterium]|nr:hypothetical protein [Chitinispirillaceae bacterium]